MCLPSPPAALTGPEPRGTFPPVRKTRRKGRSEGKKKGKKGRKKGKKGSGKKGKKGKKGSGKRKREKCGMFVLIKTRVKQMDHFQ